MLRLHNIFVTNRLPKFSAISVSEYNIIIDHRVCKVIRIVTGKHLLNKLSAISK